MHPGTRVLLCLYEQVFSASNVELVTKERMEHLTEEQKRHWKKEGSANRNPLQNFLATTGKEHKNTKKQRKRTPSGGASAAEASASGGSSRRESFSESEVLRAPPLATIKNVPFQYWKPVYFLCCRKL